MSIGTVGVIAHGGKPGARGALERLSARAGALGVRLLFDPEAARILGRPPAEPAPDLGGESDALMVLGGDGTMLHAVRELGGRDKPVLGVNLGSLGFLTSVAEADMERALESLVAGAYTTSRRSLLECAVTRPGGAPAAYRALNEIAVQAFGPRVVTVGLSVNGEEVSDFVCDGLMISTPTGSTGHSLSAGGPVLLPAARVLVVSLICPHTLSTRPLVVPDDAVLAVRVPERSGQVWLTADGQVGQRVTGEDRIEIRRAATGVRFVHLSGYSYFGVMRQKLHWRGSYV